MRAAVESWLARIPKLGVISSIHRETLKYLIFVFPSFTCQIVITIFYNEKTNSINKNKNIQIGKLEKPSNTRYKNKIKFLNLNK